MPTKRYNPTGIKIRGPRAGDYTNWQITTIANSEILDPGSESEETINDGIFQKNVGALVRRSSNVRASGATINDKIKFSSLDPSIMTIDETTGIGTYVADGNTQVRARSRSLTRTASVFASLSTVETVYSLLGFTEGSLARHCSDHVDSLLLGKTFSANGSAFLSRDYITRQTIRNPNFWAASHDLSCSSTQNSLSNNRRCVILITPRHGIIAKHYSQLHPGQTFYFTTMDGTTYPLIIEGVYQDFYPGASDNYPNDIALVKFTADAPAGIGFAELMPDDYRDYLPTIADLINLSTYTRWSTLKALAFDQEGKGLIRHVRYLGSPQGVFEATDVANFEWSETIGDGDSSQPIFLLRESGRPILLSTWTGRDNGTNLADDNPFIDPYDAAVHPSCKQTILNGIEALGAEGYSPTYADLSDFTNFS